MKFSQQQPALITRLSAVLLIAWLVLPLTALAGVVEGINWLATQQGANGGFGGTATSLATPVQTTAEVLRAYQALDRGDAR